MRTHTSTRRFLVMAIVAMTMAVSFPLAQKVSDAELLFREAQHKQQVERDINGAIRIYEGIAASKTADRAVKAKALLQLASCYEIQGRQAEKVYDQIVRDFKDQPAVVAQAQAKLAALHPPSTASTKKIEFGVGVRHVVATDGKRAVYWNDDSTTLYFGDVAGNSRNVVFTTQAVNRPIGRVVVSPDLSMVCIVFAPTGPPSPGTVPVGKGILKKTDGTGDRELDAFGWLNWPPGPGRNVVLSFEWSGNGRYLLARVQVRPELQTHLAKISVDDGRVTLLPPVSGLFGFAVSSPDDRFIALSGESGLYIIPSQGGEPRRLIADALAQAPVWTGDGKYILFRGPQSNSFALPMKDGQPAGERIAMPDPGGYQPLGTYGASIVLRRSVETRPSRQKLYLASVDDEGHVSHWKTLDVVGEAGAHPTWSPDSRQFAYTALPAGPFPAAVRVHTVAGGEDHVLWPGVRQLRLNGTGGNCLWASNRPIIYCGALQGGPPAPIKTRVISIATDTGRMEEVGSLDGVRFLERLSPDDRTLISVNRQSRTGHQWEIGTSQEKETSFAAVVESTVSESPDRRWVYRVVKDSGNRREYQIRPTSGSDADWRHLMYVNRPALVGLLFSPVPMRYTPDSKWILYHDKDANGKDGLFRVSTSGGEPQRLGDYPTSELSSLMSISPDGRQILVLVDVRASGPTLAAEEFEFALLENFNPKAAPAAPKPVKGVKK